MHDIRVEGRDRIKPTFRVPFTQAEDTVRTLVDSVEVMLPDTNTGATVAGLVLSLGRL